MKGFLAYIPAGFPDLETTRSILLEMDTLPITGVEVGVPFSDPVADGPVIQRAHQAALEQGTDLDRILDMLCSIRVSYRIYLMSYLNPLMNYPGGRKRLRVRLKSAQVRGLIIPDLPLKERKEFDLFYPGIIFTAPNTGDKEIKLINSFSPPFVYYVARYGVTGPRQDLPFLERLKQLKAKIKAPVFAGFGISTPEQVSVLSRISDGVIVGSVLVKTIAESSSHAAAEKVRSKIKYLLNDFGL